MSGSQSLPEAAANERFRQQRIGQPDLRRHVHAERAVTARVQHVRRRELLQVVGHLRTIRVLHRMEDDVHPLEDVAVALVRRQQLSEAEDVAGRRHFIGVLPAGDENRRLERGQLGQRDELAGHWQGDLHDRNAAAAVRRRRPCRR